MKPPRIATTKDGFEAKLTEREDGQVDVLVTYPDRAGGSACTARTMEQAQADAMEFVQARREGRDPR